MTLAQLDIARAKMAEAHRQADHSRDGRRLVIQRRTARRARRSATRRRGPSRLLLLIPTAGSGRR